LPSAAPAESFPIGITSGSSPCAAMSVDIPSGRGDG
jgi:hypothetical protein